MSIEKISRLIMVVAVFGLGIISVSTSVTYAAFNDVTLTTDVVISVAGINLNVSGSSATLESIVANANSFDVGMQSGSSIVIASTDRRTFTLSPSSGGFTSSTGCDASQSTLTLSGTGAVTVTVTPTSSTCTIISTSASSGSSSGGSLSGQVYNLINMGNCELAKKVMNQYASRTADQQAYFANKCITPVATTPSLTFPSVFLKNLSLGMSSEDVRRLQTFLASDKDVYPEAIISGYYGSLTQKAVQRFQVKYGVATSNDAGYGNVGPKTRAKLQEVFGATGTGTTTPSTILPAANALFSVNLVFRMRSSDVYRLQQLLATDKDVYPDGTVSGYFGRMTKKAVQKFQIKYNVVSSDMDAGYGSVGPKTRAKLQEVFK